MRNVRSQSVFPLGIVIHLSLFNKYVQTDVAQKHRCGRYAQSVVNTFIPRDGVCDVHISKLHLAALDKLTVGNPKLHVVQFVLLAFISC
jgi:hypothetical protein